MRISDLITEDNIEIAAELSDKDEAIERLIRLQRDSGGIRDMDSFRHAVNERENQGSTAMSGRIAIPYARCHDLASPRITVVTVKDGVPFNAPDKRPVRLIFLIAGDKDTDEHLMLRTRLQRLLLDTDFTARLIASSSKEEFIALIKEREDRRFPVSTRPLNPLYDCSKFLNKNNKKKRRRLPRLFHRKKRDG